MIDLAQYSDVIDLHEQGKTTQEIAQLMNLDIYTVERWIKLDDV